MISEQERLLDDSAKETLDILKYKYALENSEIGVWEWDIENKKIYHSSELKKIFGYDNPNVDLTHIHWSERIHPEDLARLESLVDDHLQNITKEYRSEHRILSLDGTYRWVFDCGKIISFNAEGKPTRLIGTTMDITQRKIDESSLNQNLSIITNQNKKLMNFAHIVTHNLKEHAGNFESLLNFYHESKESHEKKNIINHLKIVSDSLTTTIDNLREIVSKQFDKKIEIKPLNISTQINKVVKLLELEIVAKRATLINNVDKDLVLYSNEAYLESIILNLASNALKYSHPDRPLVVSINSTITEEEIAIRLSDNGIGIDLEKFGNDIFGLYNTFHGNKNAEGIGLYITKSQIESLGGTISVESEVNVGTTFTISIKQKKSS